MEIICTVIILLYLCCGLPGAQGLTSWAGNATAEDRLLADLLKGYDPRVRPVQDPLKPLTVSMYMSLQQIISLDDRSQVLTISGSIVMLWWDVHLRWNPVEYGNIGQTWLPAGEVWKPDAGVVNSVDDDHVDLSMGAKNRVTVYSFGMVLWVVNKVFQTACKLDMTRFPFDTQKCSLEVMSNTHLEHFLVLQKHSDEVSTLFYTNSTEWNLIKAEQFDGEIRFPTDSSPIGYLVMSTFIMELTIERRTGYYWVHLIIPCVFISLLVTMTFYMPSEAGEKISFSVTILLAFTVYQLLIADTLPKSSETTSLISIYLTLLIGLSATSVFFAMLVLNIHHHDPNKPVPEWAKALVFRCLATITFKRKSVKELRLESTTKVVQVQPNDSSSVNSRTQLATLGGSITPMDGGRRPTSAATNRNMSEADMRHVQFVLQSHGQIEREETPGGRYEKCWRIAAEIIDRFFFMLYMLITVGASLVMLVIIPLT